MGVRDEIGFLTIHQNYADRFFPGTSVLHTRARYAIFVPWLFEDLAGLTGPAAVRAFRERGRELAGRLKVADESQVIGGRVFPNPSSQPPSTVYWNALAVWGILRPRLDGRTISRAQAHRLLKATGAATDDDGQPLLSFDPPFVTLPDRPDSWRDGAITLRLTTAEAAFLRERLAPLRRWVATSCPCSPDWFGLGLPRRPGCGPPRPARLPAPTRLRLFGRNRQPASRPWAAPSMTRFWSVSSRLMTNGRRQPGIAATWPPLSKSTFPSQPSSKSMRSRRTLACCRRNCVLS